VTTVRLTVVASEMEADLICGMLRVNGVQCSYRKTDLAAAWTEGLARGGPVEILVFQEDLENARELLGTDE
jgi:hypothetical protein